MKKFLLGLLVVAMILGLTACSQDLSSKMGENMRKMGNNIYGIKYNPVEVAKATAAVDSSVDSEGNVDLNKAADIMKMLDGIKQSEQKTEALRESLQASAGTTGAKLAESIEATQAALATKIAALGDSNQKTVANAIYGALDAVESSVSDDPSKAEVATVAILNEMAKVVTELDEFTIENLADQGQEALDALLIVTGFGSMDLLDGLTLQSLIGGSGDKDASDGNDGNILHHLVAELIRLVSSDRKFNQTKYNSFILQAKIIRAAYDMISLKYVRNATKIEDYDALLTMNFDHGMDAEDLAKYIVAWLLVEFDNILGDNEDNVDILAKTLETLINEQNYDKLTHLADENKEFDQDALQAASKTFSNTAFLAFGINLEAIRNFSIPSATNYTDDQLAEVVLRTTIQDNYENELWAAAIADPESPYYGFGSDEEKREEFADEVVGNVFRYSEDVLAEYFTTYSIPEDPDLAEVVPEDVDAVKADRKAKITSILIADFGYADEAAVQEAIDAELMEMRESDMFFSVIIVVMQITDMFNLEQGSDKLKELSAAVQALPGDLMRFVGTAVVILRDSEWDDGLLTLLQVPANEEHKISYLLSATTYSLLGIDPEDAE